MSNPTTITSPPGLPFIDMVREYNAPRELVFRAYTDPELVVQWLGPRRLVMELGDYDARDGMAASGMESGMNEGNERLDEVLAGLSS